MRLSILAFPSHHGFTSVINACSSKGHLERELRDRHEDKIAFKGERIVRLPRRLGRALIERTWAQGCSTDSIDISRSLRAGRPLFWNEEKPHAARCNCSDCCSVLKDPYL